MWGNALGWSISALIVLATVSGLWWFERTISRVTPPTDLVRDASFFMIELPVSPDSLLEPENPADATALYRQAIDLVLNDADSYEQFVRAARRSSDAETLEALDLVLEASNFSSAQFFASSPQEVVKYGHKPPLYALRLLGNAVNRMGALLNFEKDPLVAVRYHKAAFALGARMYAERLVLEELLGGLELMSAAAAGIVAAAPDSADAARFGDFRARYLDWYASRVAPTQRILTSIDAEIIARHGGDVFAIAERSPERMWRVEAILALGRMRFHAGHVADARAAERKLAQLTSDPDPVIQTAADAAKSLTIEEYRMLR